MRQSFASLREQRPTLSSSSFVLATSKRCGIGLKSHTGFMEGFVSTTDAHQCSDT